MFEVGKKYKYIGGDTLGFVIEVLHTTNDNAMIRIINHNIPDLIGNEHVYSQSVFSWWKEYKEPRTITRWVNVYEDVKSGYLSFGNMWEDKDCAVRHARESDKTYMTYKDTITVSYTEPH